MKIIITLSICFLINIISFSQMNSSEYFKIYSRFLKQDTLEIKKVIQLSSKKNNFYTYLSKGDFYLYNENPKKSLEQYNLALEICPNIDSIESFLNFKLGYYYFYNDNYPIALQFLNKAANFVNLKINNHWHARLYMCIGIINSTLGSSERAASNFLEIINYYRNKGDSSLMMFSMNNLSISYMEMGKYNESEKYFDSCLRYRLRINDIFGVGQAQNNIGTLNFKQEKFEEALRFYKLGYESRLNAKAPLTGLIESKINIGKTFVQLNNPKEALIWLENAYEESVKSKHSELQKRATEYLKEAYYALGEFQKAYRFQEIYFHLYDTLYGLDKKIAVENISIQNQLQSKMYKDSLYTAEKNKNESAIALEKEKRNRIIFISLGGGILFLSFFVFQLYRSNYLRKKTNAIILAQKNSIDKKQKEILDSFHYAKRIQYTLLAHEEILKQNLREHFVLFMPKDIVSGDFYWCTKKGDDFYLAVCDCTGHGVPGAFMSLLNITFLNEAINEKNISEPHEVLNHVRERLIQNMEGAQDGMDATLIKFNGKTLKYASAQNRPLFIRNGKMMELNSDKMPVGKGDKKESFSLHEIELHRGDTIYFYTDGFADQFGGPKGKKFKYSNLQNIILENSDKVMNFQSQNLKNKFVEWQGELEQVDDVCIIGIRI
jgi:serine phosphatase RsbU (regulator of sigma subunit)